VRSFNLFDGELDLERDRPGFRIGTELDYWDGET
jgi:hypothetical protein